MTLRGFSTLKGRAHVPRSTEVKPQLIHEQSTSRAPAGVQQVWHARVCMLPWFVCLGRGLSFLFSLTLEISRVRVRARGRIGVGVVGVGVKVDFFVSSLAGWLAVGW